MLQEIEAIGDLLCSEVRRGRMSILEHQIPNIHRLYKLPFENEDEEKALKIRLDWRRMMARVKVTAERYGFTWIAEYIQKEFFDKISEGNLTAPQGG